MSVLADRTFTTMKSEKTSMIGTNSMEDKKMKKITFAILAIAFIAAFNSCKEEEEIQTPDEDNWEYFMKQYDESSQMYQVSVEEMLLGAYGVTLDEFKSEIMGVPMELSSALMAAILPRYG